MLVTEVPYSMIGTCFMRKCKHNSDHFVTNSAIQHLRQHHIRLCIKPIFYSLVFSASLYEFSARVMLHTWDVSPLPAIMPAEQGKSKRITTMALSELTAISYRGKFAQPDLASDICRCGPAI